MKIKFICRFIIMFLTIVAGQAQSPSLIPLPKSMNIKAGQLRISGKFIIGLSSAEKDDLLTRAIVRLADKIGKKSIGQLHPILIKNGESLDSAAVIIMEEKSVSMQLGMDESYRLSVNENQVVLHAHTTIAALRGMETILQLLASDDKGFYFPEIEINDSPRFPWRGLMIDVSRHFIPIEDLRRNIEAMSEVKMNILHLHLSDNEGFRFESMIFPELQAKGSNGKYLLKQN